MSKLGTDGKPHLDGNGKAIKPEHYIPPDVSGALL
jgi:predicted HAD superfamily Cof-like phosphohydrolase